MIDTGFNKFFLDNWISDKVCVGLFHWILDVEYQSTSGTNVDATNRVEKSAFNRFLTCGIHHTISKACRLTIVDKPDFTSY